MNPLRSGPGRVRAFFRGERSSRQSPARTAPRPNPERSQRRAPPPFFNRMTSGSGAWRRERLSPSVFRMLKSGAGTEGRGRFRLSQPCLPCAEMSGPDDLSRRGRTGGNLACRPSSAPFQGTLTAMRSPSCTHCTERTPLDLCSLPVFPVSVRSGCPSLRKMLEYSKAHPPFGF